MTRQAVTDVLVQTLQSPRLAGQEFVDVERAPRSAVDGFVEVRKGFCRAASRGVTLVEVLIVVAIMAMLAGGVAFALLPKFGDTQNKVASQGATEIRRMVQTFQIDKGGECPTLSQLRKEGLMDKAGTSADPWGSPYQIRCEDNEIWVLSLGKDKKKGTPDDIEVPGPEKKGE
jgi:general secretion pathway protein G